MNNFLNEKERNRLQILSNIIRYNNELHVHDENVAEHSFYVAIYAMEICNCLGIDDATTLNCIKLALIHDVHEIELSDIPHNVKEELPQLKKICEDVEKEFNQKYFESIKNSGISKTIVELADCLSVLQYSTNEIERGNSGRFHSIKEKSKNRILKCLDELCGIDRRVLHEEIFEK